MGGFFCCLKQENVEKQISGHGDPIDMKINRWKTQHGGAGWCKGLHQTQRSIKPWAKRRPTWGGPLQLSYFSAAMWVFVAWMSTSGQKGSFSGQLKRKKVNLPHLICPVEPNAATVCRAAFSTETGNKNRAKWGLWQFYDTFYILSHHIKNLFLKTMDHTSNRRSGFLVKMTFEVKMYVFIG